MKERPNLANLVEKKDDKEAAAVERTSPQPSATTTPVRMHRVGSRVVKSGFIEELDIGEVASFLPNTLRAHLKDVGGMEGITYNCENCHGVVLYMDIVGFTVIMDKFVRLDHGAEKMSHHLNYTFGVILKQIGMFQGDALQFSGDAVMAGWKTTDPTNLKNLITLATQCGEAVVNAVGRRTITVGDETVDLMLHVGLAAGPLSTLIVGGVRKQWKFVTIGRAVSDAANASVLAQADQIVMTQETVELAKPLIAANPMLPHPGYALLTRTNKKTPLVAAISPRTLPSIHLMNSFLSSAVTGLLYELKQHGGDVRRRSTNEEPPLTAGEVRTISSLFIKLLIDATSESMPIIHSAYSTIQRRLGKTGGAANKLIYDDKGLITLCVYGLPGMSHEDDAIRSVTFAKEVLSRLESKNILACIGVSRSRAYCGICGSDTRREYTVLGDGVNLAARLMGQAEDLVGQGDPCIVVDEATKESCNGAHEFTEASRVNVKGKDQLVKVYKVVATALTYRSRNSSSERITHTIKASPSLRRSESFLSSASSTSTVITPRSLGGEQVPASPCTVVSNMSINSASSGITVITPLAKSLRNMAKVAAVHSSSSATNSAQESTGSSQHLFPCTTNQGSLIVIGRIEEMKAISHCIDRLSENDQVARFTRTVKRKLRRTITPAVTDPDSSGSNDDSAVADYITLEEEGNGERFRSFSKNTPRGLVSKKSFASVAQSVGTTVDYNPPQAATPIDMAIAKVDVTSENDTPPPRDDTSSQQSSPSLDSTPDPPSSSGTTQPSVPIPLPLPLGLTRNNHGSHANIHPRSPESEGSRLRRRATVSTIDLSKPRFILFEGEVGIGKSLLLHKAAEMARDKRVVGHMTSGEMINRRKPYSVFTKLVGDLLVERGVEGFQLGPLHVAGLKLICEELADGLEAVELEGAQEKMAAANEVIRHVLSKYNKGHGYMLFVDDAQWLDDLSWSAMLFLAEHEPAASFVMTKRIRGIQPQTNIMADDEQNTEKFQQGLMQSISRSRLPSVDDELDVSIKSASSASHSTDAEVDELEELAKGTTYKVEFLSEYRSYGGSFVFQLTPFNRDMSSLFYKMVLSVKAVDPAVFDYAYERSSGNPGVAERLFVALNSKKALVVLGDRVVEFTPAVHPSDFAHVVPPDVEAMFVSVTDKLPHDQQYHLKVMSVLGLTFPLPLLSIVAGLPEDKMKDVCDSLTSNAILIHTPNLPGSADSMYSFRVPLLRDCVYHKMLQHQRRDMHLKVVYALDGSGQHDPKIIAEHLVQAEDDRAVEYLSAAAGKEFTANNHRTAHELIKQLLDCSRKTAPLGHTIMWTRRLIICSLNTGKYRNTKSLLTSQSILLDEPALAPTKTNILKANLAMSMVSIFPCCISSVPATVEDKEMLAERLFYTQCLTNTMLFEAEVAPLELVCLRGLRQLGAFKKSKTKTPSKRRGKRFSLGSAAGLVSAPEEAWGDEPDQLEVDRVEPALKSTLKYLEYCKRGVGGVGDVTNVYQRGLAQPYGMSPAAMYCVAAKMEPDVTSSIVLFRDIQAAAAKKADVYTVHLSLSLQITLEILRGQVGDALIVAGELREACKAEPSRDTRFGLYALGLGCIVLYTHMEAPPNLNEPRERIENVLLYSDSSSTEVADKVLLALLGIALALGLSREEDSDTAMNVVRQYKLVSAMLKVELYTPFHFIMLPCLMEVLLRAYVVRASKDADPIYSCIEKYKEMSGRFPITLPGYLYWKGEVLKAKGEVAGAAAAWREGIEASVTLKMPYNGALCKAGLALLSNTGEKDVNTYLQQAAEVFAMCKTNDCLPL